MHAGALRMKGELQSPPRTAWGLRDVQDVLPAAKAVRLLGGSPFRGLQDEMPRRRQFWLMAWYQFCRMSSQACVLACCLTHPARPLPGPACCKLWARHLVPCTRPPGRPHMQLCRTLSTCKALRFVKLPFVLHLLLQPHQPSTCRPAPCGLCMNPGLCRAAPALELHPGAPVPQSSSGPHRGGCCT